MKANTTNTKEKTMATTTMASKYSDFKAAELTEDNLQAMIDYGCSEWTITLVRDVGNNTLETAEVLKFSKDTDDVEPGKALEMKELANCFKDFADAMGYVDGLRQALKGKKWNQIVIQAQRTGSLSYPQLGFCVWVKGCQLSPLTRAVIKAYSAGYQDCSNDNEIDSVIF